MDSDACNGACHRRFATIPAALAALKRGEFVVVLDDDKRENEGDLIALDMGSGLPFRPGTLDGAVSISAVQWLCNADKTSHVPQRRLGLFFSSLYRALARGANLLATTLFFI